MRYIGIDYGAKGALASLSETGEILQLTKMPEKSDGSIDAIQVKIWLWEEYIACNGNMLITGERLHAIFGSSAKSTFSFALNIGKVLSQIETMKIPYQEVRAVDWQEYVFGICLYCDGERFYHTEEMGDVKINKKGKLTYKRDTKAMASFAFDALYPEYERPTTDGERDAVLIAEYARRTHGKGS